MRGQRRTRENQKRRFAANGVSARAADCTTGDLVAAIRGPVPFVVGMEDTVPLDVSPESGENCCGLNGTAADARP